jgi:hypothetical protein
MPQHRFQILASLLITLQLLIPSGAPWLHLHVESDCCALAAESSRHEETQDPTHRHSADTCSHQHSQCQPTCGDQCEPRSNTGSGKSDSEPHDCSNCPVCQAIAAPRTITCLIELPAVADRIELLSVCDSADPMLGFGLPCQCRAPPCV